MPPIPVPHPESAPPPPPPATIKTSDLLLAYLDRTPLFVVLAICVAPPPELEPVPPPLYAEIPEESYVEPTSPVH